MKLRPIERAGFLKGHGEKKYQERDPARQRRLRQRRDPARAFVVKGGAYVYGSYPESTSCSQSRRPSSTEETEAMLHKMQQLVYEKTVIAPIWQLAFINAVGPRVGESGFSLIPPSPIPGRTRT